MQQRGSQHVRWTHRGSYASTHLPRFLCFMIIAPSLASPDNEAALEFPS
jgi:hypothetical protein